MTRLSTPFYATKAEQIPYRHGFDATEAVLFERKDLEQKSWKTVWENIKKAAQFFGSQNVSFHFPFNKCNFVEDRFVYERLVEALKRATDLGLAGIVTHAAQVRKKEDWIHKDPNALRQIVSETLARAFRESDSGVWLGLENLPVIGNYGLEIDPTFVYPSDFDLLHEELSITWDFCHWHITQCVSERFEREQLAKEDFPFVHSADKELATALCRRVAHVHFSAFQGIPLSGGANCTQEGLLPWNSGHSQEVYLDFLKVIKSKMHPETMIVLEIAEKDYTTRENAVALSDWVRNALA